MFGQHHDRSKQTPRVIEGRTNDADTHRLDKRRCCIRMLFQRIGVACHVAHNNAPARLRSQQCRLTLPHDTHLRISSSHSSRRRHLRSFERGKARIHADAQATRVFRQRAKYAKRRKLLGAIRLADVCHRTYAIFEDARKNARIGRRNKLFEVIEGGACGAHVFDARLPSDQTIGASPCIKRIRHIARYARKRIQKKVSATRNVIFDSHNVTHVQSGFAEICRSKRHASFESYRKRSPSRRRGD